MYDFGFASQERAYLEPLEERDYDREEEIEEEKAYWERKRRQEDEVLGRDW